MVEGVPAVFDEYNSEALETVRQSLLKRYTQVLKARGDNDSEVGHIGSEQRQRWEGSVRAVEISIYETALAWWMDATEDRAHDNVRAETIEESGVILPF